MIATSYFLTEPHSDKSLQNYFPENFVEKHFQEIILGPSSSQKMDIFYIFRWMKWKAEKWLKKDKHGRIGQTWKKWIKVHNS